MLRGSGSRDALDILFVLDCPVVAVPDAIVVDDYNEDCLIDNDFLELFKYDGLSVLLNPPILEFIV